MRAWYEEYFSADYWVYARDEYTPARTSSEAAYLASVLDALAPGRRVLDVGCGLGRHSVALARLGFDVVGVDVSPWAVARATASALASGASPRFFAVDALLASTWPVAAVDAVVCVQAFGWGTDAQQARLLRSLRRLLVPGGVLVLDHSNLSAIMRIYSPRTEVTVDGHTFEFLRHYDQLTGRSGGTLRVRRPSGEVVTAVDDVRLYQPSEVAALLASAGFEVLRADADFVAGGAVGLDTRYVQFVARSPGWPVPALAGHRADLPAGALNLRWAPDEAPFTTSALATAWSSVVSGSPSDGPDGLRRYDLADPYGAARAVDVLSAHFGVGLDAARVTAGAGATGLLRALAMLAAGAPVLVEPAGHPELALAAGELGAAVRAVELDPDVVRSAGPAVTVLDRPGVTGSVWPLARVRELADAAADAGGVLVVDETCASYLPPGESAVALTADARGLVVVRSMSKGYCCGGLRVGFAVASPDLASRVRAVCPPLGTAALSLDVALALLSQGDILAGLRARVGSVKSHFVELLAAHGLHARPGHPHLPWITLELPPAPATSAAPGATDATDAAAQLAELGIAGKDVPVAPGWPGLLRLSVPLSDERWQAAQSALAGAPGGVGGVRGVGLG